MKNTDWKETAEFIGIVAIVASLVFIGMQMQQDRLHAHAELGADSFSNLASISLELTNAEFAIAFAKAIEKPAELTTAEKLQVNGYLDAFTYLVIRECYLQLKGLFDECEIIVREYGPKIFGNHYAQSWWNLHGAGELSFMPPWIDEAITGIDPESNLRSLNALQIDH